MVSVDRGYSRKSPACDQKKVYVKRMTTFRASLTGRASAFLVTFVTEVRNQSRGSRRRQVHAYFLDEERVRSTHRPGTRPQGPWELQQTGTRRLCAIMPSGLYRLPEGLNRKGWG